MTAWGNLRKNTWFCSSPRKFLKSLSFLYIFSNSICQESRVDRAAPTMRENSSFIAVALLWCIPTKCIPRMPRRARRAAGQFDSNLQADSSGLTSMGCFFHRQSKCTNLIRIVLLQDFISTTVQVGNTRRLFVAWIEEPSPEKLVDQLFSS